MPGRKYSSGGSYRYGFNGKENDNNVKGEGNQIDYGERIYDPRLGKFLSIDPFEKKYPFYSPYQFAGNTPIQAIDLDGLEPYKAIAKDWKTFRQICLDPKNKKWLFEQAANLDGIGVEPEPKSGNSRFNMSHYATMKLYFGLNSKAKTENAPLGDRTSENYCQFNCITSIGEGLKILYGTYIPVTGNANDYISKNLSKYTSKTINFKVNYENKTDVFDTKVKDVSVNVADEMVKSVNNKAGVYFFAGSLGDGDHANMYSMIIGSDNSSPEFFKFDNIKNRICLSKDELNENLKAFYQLNTNKDKSRLPSKGKIILLK